MTKKVEVKEAKKVEVPKVQGPKVEVQKAEVPKVQEPVVKEAPKEAPSHEVVVGNVTHHLDRRDSGTNYNVSDKLPSLNDPDQN